MTKMNDVPRTPEPTMPQALGDTYTLANGVEIPVIGFGTWKLPNDDVGVEAVRTAIETGYRHIDTAAAYRNEPSVGEGIRRSGIARDELFVTTKLDNPDHGYEATKHAFESSLEALGLDYVDLYLIHWPNPKAFRDRWQEANAETWRAFEEFYKEGKIRALGVSNFREHHLDALAETATVGPHVNQIRICPGDVPEDLIETCRSRHILLEAYSPLGSGEIFDLAAFKEIAEATGKTVAQVAIRWSLQKGFLPLPKTKTPSRIKENAEVFDFSLTDEQMAAIDSLEDGIMGHASDPDTISW